MARDSEQDSAALFHGTCITISTRDSAASKCTPVKRLLLLYRSFFVVHICFLFTAARTTSLHRPSERLFHKSYKQTSSRTRALIRLKSIRSPAVIIPIKPELNSNPHRFC